MKPRWIRDRRSSRGVQWPCLHSCEESHAHVCLRVRYHLGPHVHYCDARAVFEEAGL